MASTYYTISDNIAIDSTNACYGQFEHPAHFEVKNNFCRSAAGNAILVTGTNIDLLSSQKALDGLVMGNVIEGGRSGGGHIWVNGLGAPGSGASQIRIIANHIESGNIAQACIRISGAGENNIIRSNTCVGGLAAAIVDNKDSGGRTENTLIEDNNIKVVAIADGGGQAIIVSNGDGTRIEHNLLSSISSYPAAIKLGGTNQIVRDNIAEGYLVKYITRDADKFTIQR